MRGSARAPGIHPTALVEDGAKVHPDAIVGPMAWVASGAVIGAGARIGARAVVGPGVRVGEASLVDTGAVVGHVAQPSAEPSVEIGRGAQVREYAVVEPGHTTPTWIADFAFVMGRTRIGAGSRIGERAVVTHGSIVGADACLEAGAVVGGLALVEHGVVVGQGAMVAAMSRVVRPVPPFVLVHGAPARPVGLNVVGLRRSGARPDARLALQRAFRLLFRSGLSLDEAERRLSAERAEWPELDRLLAFLRRYGSPGEAPPERR
ncbi:DapH/DapD/GlmU-related protein [Geochorda subterranea]|uniref:DapH/DapD/GlmU-related protein n=1 Tax=Geochorda subterranea TaxID=3109564 RepID=A0ABZ1BKW7_9FIRM|nr:DapH/DapD/GlmU-related protein [Limnochorda sp. LNt]WRP13349.1 DapH/DapD/GlmU-related protein [Limnochorda sp. LNt]